MSAERGETHTLPEALLLLSLETPRCTERRKLLKSLKARTLPRDDNHTAVRSAAYPQLMAKPAWREQTRPTWAWVQSAGLEAPKRQNNPSSSMTATSVVLSSFIALKGLKALTRALPEKRRVSSLTQSRQFGMC